MTAALLLYVFSVGAPIWLLVEELMCRLPSRSSEREPRLPMEAPYTAPAPTPPSAYQE